MSHRAKFGTIGNKRFMKVSFRSSSGSASIAPLQHLHLRGLLLTTLHLRYPWLVVHQMFNILSFSPVHFPRWKPNQTLNLTFKSKQPNKTSHHSSESHMLKHQQLVEQRKQSVYNSLRTLANSTPIRTFCS